MATRKNPLVCNYCGIIDAFERDKISMECARANAAVPFGGGGKSNTILGLTADRVIIDDPMEADAFKLPAKVTPETIQAAGEKFFAENGADAHFYPMPKVGSTTKMRLSEMMEVAEALQKQLAASVNDSLQDMTRDVFLYGFGARKLFVDTSSPAEKDTSAKGRLVAFTGNSSWIDSENKTGLRDTSLSAGWGLMQPSRERLHKSRRPKRCGW